MTTDKKNDVFLRNTPKTIYRTAYRVPKTQLNSKPDMKDYIGLSFLVQLKRGNENE